MADTSKAPDKGRDTSKKKGDNNKKPETDIERDALLREVEEELRREQIAKLWDRYGSYVLMAAIALIAAVGGYRVWESRQIAKVEASGALYDSAMKLAAAGKGDEAEAKLNELAASGTGYAALARLQQAGALVKAGRPADAVGVFDALSKDAATDTMLRNFAAIQAAALRVGEADFTEMKNRLNDLAQDASSWRHVARELIGLAAIKAGKPDEARTALLATLGDKDAPEASISRARILLGRIATEDLAKAGTETSPAPAASGSEVAPAAATPAAGGDAGTAGGAQP